MRSVALALLLPTCVLCNGVPVGCHPHNSVATGGGHTCAIVTGGSVRCWGAGGDGQLASGRNSSIGRVPGDIEGLLNVYLGPGVRAVAITAGLEHTCIITDELRVICWGYSGIYCGYRGTCDSAGLGYGSTESIGDEPNEVVSAGYVPLRGKAVAISAGSFHTCCILEGGDVQCWCAHSNPVPNPQLQLPFGPNTFHPFAPGGPIAKGNSVWTMRAAGGVHPERCKISGLSTWVPRQWQ